MTASAQFLTIEAVTERLIDYRGKTPPKADAGVRLVTAKVIKGGRILNEPAEYITEEVYAAWMRRGLPQRNDVLLTTEAPLGEVALVRDDRVALAQRVILLRADPRVVDPQYLFYALQAPDSQVQMQARASGTTVAGIKQSELRRVLVRIPAMREQRRVVALLSPYDALLQNCEHRIRLLDRMTRATYREWFELFRYPGHDRVPLVASAGGKIPRGWKHAELRTVAGVNAKQIDTKNPPERIKYIDISSVSPGRVDGPTEYLFGDAPGRARRVIAHGDVIWSCVRPNRRSYALMLHPESSTVASTGFAVLTAKSVPFAYLFAAATTDEFVGYLEKRATGAAYPAVTAKVFEDALLLVPDALTLQRFATFATPLAELRAAVQLQAENLHRTRDLLLPRLLSGKLTLNAAA